MFRIEVEIAHQPEASFQNKFAFAGAAYRMCLCGNTLKLREKKTTLLRNTVDVLTIGHRLLPTSDLPALVPMPPRRNGSLHVDRQARRGGGVGTSSMLIIAGEPCRKHLCHDSNGAAPLTGVGMCQTRGSRRCQCGKNGIKVFCEAKLLKVRHVQKRTYSEHTVNVAPGGPSHCGRV